MSERGRQDYVPEEHLSQTRVRCPVCRDEGEATPAGLLQSDPDVELLQCNRCGAASASRMPDEVFLKSLYSPEHYVSDLFATTHAVGRCGAHIADLLPAMDTDAPLKVIDYGGGDGSLSCAVRDAMRNRGHRGEIEMTVVDYFVDQRSDDSLRFLDVADFVQQREQFDVVIASAVLEHLTDLTATSRKLLSLCKPGASFYARTPYEQPLASVVPGYRIRWPRHVHDLGPLFWAKFLEQMGFVGDVLHSSPSIVESDFSSRPARTLLAQLLKAPGHLESRLFPRRVAREGRVLWPFVGGWEVLLRVDRAGA